jgi:RIO kinase 1
VPLLSGAAFLLPRATRVAFGLKEISVPELPLLQDGEDEYHDGLAGPAGLRRSQGREHLEQLDAFFDHGLVTDLVGIIKTGKEASAYCCRGSSTVGGGLVCVKIFRARQYRFKNDAVYQEERTRGMRGRPRRALSSKSDFGREVQTGSWVAHEYETLDLLHDAGVSVPRPYAIVGDALLMEYIGDEGEPAPQLNKVRLDSREAGPLFDAALRNVELMLANNRVHADLSAHNILYWKGQLTLIDFPQAVDPRFNTSAQSLLRRDIENVCRHFAGFGVESNPRALADDLWRRFVYADL